MTHNPYKRIVPDARCAVLFIHGIVGTPNHFQPFVNCVAPEVSVHNLLLDGHGKTATDFSKASMDRWSLQVQQAVAELSATHQQVYIVAHSLGTLLALEQARKNRRISKLFLLAVPAKVFLRPSLPLLVGRVFFNKIADDDPVGQAALRCYGIAPDKNPLHYLGWAPRFIELLGKIREVNSYLHQISTPCMIYQSSKDELVANSAAALLKRLPNSKITILNGSTHYYYAPEDMTLLLQQFEKWLLA